MSQYLKIAITDIANVWYSALWLLKHAESDNALPGL
jgi:hypothetical protein